jgi:hypothetical protein
LKPSGSGIARECANLKPAGQFASSVAVYWKKENGRKAQIGQECFAAK